MWRGVGKCESKGEGLDAKFAKGAKFRKVRQVQVLLQDGENKRGGIEAWLVLAASHNMARVDTLES